MLFLLVLSGIQCILSVAPPFLKTVLNIPKMVLIKYMFFHRAFFSLKDIYAINHNIRFILSISELPALLSWLCLLTILSISLSSKQHETNKPTKYANIFLQNSIFQADIEVDIGPFYLMIHAQIHMKLWRYQWIYIILWTLLLTDKTLFRLIY